MNGFMANGSVQHVIASNVAPGLIGATTSVSVAVVVPGAAVGDAGFFVPRQANATGIVFGGAQVLVAGTVQLRFTNPTAGGITPPATDDYDVYLFKATGDPVNV